MTRVKICGITNLDDARAAVDYGADALGFIYVPGTPRYVGSHPEAIAAADAAPPFITRVAVCADPGLPELLDNARFDALQFYAQHWTAVDYLGRRMIQAFRVRDAGTLEEIAAALERARPDAVHLDGYVKDKLGGSGETFNWDLAVEAKRRFGLPTILAGGLTPENVAEAVATVRPYAVDVSSGVEAEPGRKDHAKLKAFIAAARRA